MKGGRKEGREGGSGVVSAPRSAALCVDASLSPVRELYTCCRRPQRRKKINPLIFQRICDATEEQGPSFSTPSIPFFDPFSHAAQQPSLKELVWNKRGAHGG